MKHTLIIGLSIAMLGTSAVCAENAPTIATAPKGSQMRDVIAKLSPQGQETFKSDWLAIERQATQQRRNAAHIAEDAVFDAMAAEPFNPAALRHAYDVQRIVNDNNQRQRHEHLVTILTKLSPADRATVVTMLRAMRDQRGNHAQ